MGYQHLNFRYWAFEIWSVDSWNDGPTDVMKNIPFTSTEADVANWLQQVQSKVIC